MAIETQAQRIANRMGDTIATLKAQLPITEEARGHIAGGTMAQQWEYITYDKIIDALCEVIYFGASLSRVFRKIDEMASEAYMYAAKENRYDSARGRGQGMAVSCVRGALYLELDRISE